MAEYPAWLASGELSLENVQVSAADRRFRDPHNRVGRRLQVGLGAFVEAFLARTVINQGFHGILHSQSFARSQSSVYEDDRQSLAREEFARHAAQDKFHGSRAPIRSEEHTSELQSLMRNSYAVFCLKKQITHLN